MKRFSIFLILVLVGLLSAACSASTANIKSAELGRAYDQGKITDPTTTFSKTDIFHCAVEVANAPEDTTVRFVWTAIDTTDAAGATYKDQKIEETTFSTKDIGSVVHATLTNNGDWPVGTYKVDIYLNDKLDRTLNFSVVE